YIISPFTSVVSGVRNELRKALRDTEENLEYFLTNNIGTVHKFQGKEANEVIFLLGCDESSAGAVKWVNSNIVNVAATRAKFRLYIIGDRSENVWQKNKFLKIAMTLLD
ncbi:MAG: AAA domain-containing protein, partial [Oscillospiraceae bacterium]|nr:AAA domain-containing protein [Oscillospiraceae bacterium]